MQERPQKITFAEMRSPAFAGWSIAQTIIAAIAPPSVGIFGRTMFGCPRPNFDWDKSRSLTTGY
jgi:hypothetical protein